MRYWFSAAFISAVLLMFVSTARAENAQAVVVSVQGQGPANVDIASGSEETRYLKVVDALKANGYTIQSIAITFLNRAVIRASNAAHLREIVISRASGEILRDAIVEEYHTIPLSMDGQMKPIVPEMIIKNSPSGILIISQ